VRVRWVYAGWVRSRTRRVCLEVEPWIEHGPAALPILGAAVCGVRSMCESTQFAPLFSFAPAASSMRLQVC
jgi:hypothetical protein